MSNRKSAIEQEISKSNRMGSSKYSYVNQTKLERMGITQWKPSAGDNFIRIIPPKDPLKFYGREVFIHTNIGADGATFVCPLKMNNEPCPICEYRQKIRSKDPDSELVVELTPRSRYLFFIYDVKSEKAIEEGLRWFDSPIIIKDNIVSLSKDRRTGEIVDVSDLEDGRDVEFVKVGNGLKTRYEGFKLVKADPVPESWVENVPDFDDVVIVCDYETLKSELMGDVLNGETKSTSTSRRKAATEDDVDTEVIDEEEERPRRASQRRTSREPEVGEEKPAEESEEKDIRARLDEIRKRRRAEDE